MPNIYMNRADGGKHTQSFITGGYVAIGWLNDTDLGDVRHYETIYEFLQLEHPDENNNTIGAWAGSVSRFVLEIQPGDHVLTPDINRRWLWHGRVNSDYLWVAQTGDCPYRHRRLVQWAVRPLDRYQLPEGLQQTLGSPLTVFRVAELDAFLGQVYG